MARWAMMLPLGGTPVAGHHHAVGEAQRDHRRAVRNPLRGRLAGAGREAARPARARTAHLKPPDETGEVGPRILASSGRAAGSPAATRRPFARSCARTPRRCPPSTSSISSRRSSSSAFSFSPAAEVAGDLFDDRRRSARVVGLLLLLAFCHRLLSLAAQPVQQLGRARTLLQQFFDMFGRSLQWIHHRDAPQGVGSQVEHQRIPVGGGHRRTASSSGTCPGTRPGSSRGGSVTAAATVAVGRPAARCPAGRTATAPGRRSWYCRSSAASRWSSHSQPWRSR